MWFRRIFQDCLMQVIIFVSDIERGLVEHMDFINTYEYKAIQIKGLGKLICCFIIINFSMK